MGKKTTTKIPEGKLIKALAELEEAIEKGDALEAADPEGGLAAEGTPLSTSSKKHSVSKARSASSSSSSSSDDDDAEKAMSVASSVPPKMKKKDVSKSKSASDDGDADDDSSAEKSFREVADQDEVMSKAIDISPFLSSMVDQLSLTILSMKKSMKSMEETFQNTIAELESRLNARLDTRVAKGFALQTNFNSRLAQAVTAIGTSVEEQSDLVKSFGNQPAAPRGRALLSKGEVNQPPWAGSQQQDPRMANGSEGNYLAELADVPPEKIGDWLFQKSISNQVDPKLIMAWEADRYSIEALPEQVRKDLVNDLCK